MPGTSLVPDRVLVTAAVVLTAVLFLTSAADPVNVIKLTALLLCAVGLVALAAVRAVRERVLRVPTGLPAYAGAALAAGFVVAALVAPHHTTAVIGTIGRNSGLLAYGSAVVVYLAVLRCFDAPATRLLAYGLAGAGLFTASYGLLQYAHIDAVHWSNPFNPIIGALGNPDFASGYLGIAVPVATWGALRRDWSLAWRIGAGATALLCLVAAGLSSAIQGPLAAAAGLAVLAAAVLLEQPERLRRTGLAVLGAVAGLGVLVIALGLGGIGPVAALSTRISFRARIWYWDAALSMFSSHPLFGVGLDSYGIYWRTLRPLESAREIGGSNFSDAAHSVPLQMLAQGGVLLGLTYLAFVVAVAVTLVRGLRRQSGPQRLLLGGLGGSWAAYQVQSVVSIDQVPLLVAHFALAGAVVAAAGGLRLHEVRLPGAPAVAPAPSERRGGRRRVVLPRERRLDGLDYGLLGGVALLALVTAWFSLTPLRASSAVRSGDVALHDGKGNAAEAAYRHATDLVPGLGQYWGKLGSLYNKANQPQKAYDAFRSGVRHEPQDPAAVRTAGRLAEARGDLAAAHDYLTRGVQLEPTNDAAILDLAGFDLRHGRAGEALTLLERGVRDLPKSPGLWAALGDARAATGDRAGARTAYTTALTLQPGEPTATAGLAKLPAGA